MERDYIESPEALRILQSARANCILANTQSMKTDDGIVGVYSNGQPITRADGSINPRAHTSATISNVDAQDFKILDVQNGMATLFNSFRGQLADQPDGNRVQIEPSMFDLTNLDEAREIATFPNAKNAWNEFETALEQPMLADKRKSLIGRLVAHVQRYVAARTPITAEKE